MINLHGRFHNSIKRVFMRRLPTTTVASCKAQSLFCTYTNPIRDSTDAVVGTQEFDQGGLVERRQRVTTATYIQSRLHLL